MKLDPKTRHDFHRIYAHHESYSSAEKAERVEEVLYEDALICDSSQTVKFRELTYKRVRNGYRFFYVQIDGVNVIYAIYHQREDWQNLIGRRYDTLDEA